MSVTSVAIIWLISCDHRYCPHTIHITSTSCTQALTDAETHGWQTHHDGTALCPEHKTQKGPHQ